MGAVIHFHPEMAVALTAARQKIFAFHLHSRKFGRPVPVAPWLYGIWREDGEEATKRMEDNCALMIQGHEAIVTGETPEEACMNVVQLERVAKMIFAAASLGKMTPLSQKVIKKFHSLVQRRVNDAREQGKPLVPLKWRCYEPMVKKGQRWSRLQVPPRHLIDHFFALGAGRLSSRQDHTSARQICLDGNHAFP